MNLDLAGFTHNQRQRLLDALDLIRDNGMSLSSAALKARQAVWLGTEDDGDKLAAVIGQSAEIHRIAMGLAKELGAD